MYQEEKGEMDQEDDLCKNAKESNFHLATWIVFILGLCGQKLEKNQIW